MDDPAQQSSPLLPWGGWVGDALAWKACASHAGVIECIWVAREPCAGSCKPCAGLAGGGLQWDVVPVVEAVVTVGAGRVDGASVLIVRQ